MMRAFLPSVLYLASLNIVYSGRQGVGLFYTCFYLLLSFEFFDLIFIRWEKSNCYGIKTCNGIAR